MTVIYCKDCKVLLNADIEPRLSRSINCDCHNNIQKLAVRMPDDATSWHLSSRARLLALDDSLFNDCSWPRVILSPRCCSPRPARSLPSSGSPRPVL